MIALSIVNENSEENTKDKSIGFSFRRKYQLSVGVIWKLFEKLAQSDAKFNALDPLMVTVHSLKIPVGFGCVKSNGRKLDSLAHLKKSIVRVDADTNCKAYALYSRSRNWKSIKITKRTFRVRKIRPVVQRLAETIGRDLPNGGVFPELECFQNYFHEQ
jgi:hypothetical protein